MTEKRTKALALAAETVEPSGEPKYTLVQIAAKVGASLSSVSAWVATAREEQNGTA